MFGIGMPEMLLILAVALIVIGPKKLPELAKSLGKAMGEFKKATSDLKDSLQIDDEIKSVKSSFDDLNREFKGTRSTNSKPVQKEPADDEKAEAASEPEDQPEDQKDQDPLEEVKTAFDRTDDPTQTDTVSSTGDPRPDADSSTADANPDKT